MADYCAICAQVGGPLVTCAECRLRKKPFGRDAAANGYCDSDCPGYPKLPAPGPLWPGERYGEALGHADWHESYAWEVEAAASPSRPPETR